MNKLHFLQLQGYDYHHMLLNQQKQETLHSKEGKKEGYDDNEVEDQSKIIKLNYLQVMEL